MTANDFISSVIHFQKDLLRFALRLTSGEREAANDLLQETLLKVLSNEDRFLPNSNLKQWLYTIMRNLFINNYRRQSRSHSFSDLSDQRKSLINIPQQEDCTLDELYDTKEIYRIVNALPTDYRIPFIMHVSGFKYKEIAEKLNLPIGTVKSRIHLTRQRLRCTLKDYR